MRQDRPMELSTETIFFSPHSLINSVSSVTAYTATRSRVGVSASPYRRVDNMRRCILRRLRRPSGDSNHRRRLLLPPLTIRGNRLYPASYQGKPFSGKKKVFLGPLSKIRCRKHQLLIIVDGVFAWIFNADFRFSLSGEKNSEQQFIQKE